jgi:short subunit dehydrogenase-like uncharacterized protein
MFSDFVVLGASGATGRMITRRLIERGASVVLAGRDAGRLAEIAPEARVCTVDLSDPTSLRAATSAGQVVVNTIGPFARLSPAVVSASLDTGSHYVDIGNERASVQTLFDRDDEARARGVSLVTGAGFGLTSTESLVLTLLAGGVRPARVVVAAAAGSARETDGVRTTVAETMADGATTYVHGELHRAPIGQGATTLTFGGETRQVIPAPMGDLVAARRLTGADHVTAYTVIRRSGTESYAYAEIIEDDGTTHAAELRTGEGFEYTATIATETAMRLLNDTPKPGAWTPCHLFGIDIVTSVPGTEITGR